MRISEVGVRDFLAFEHEVFELVVGAEDGFGRGVRQKILHLHLDGGGTAAALGVFSLNDDHRILADHEDVADAQFLCGFHLNKFPVAEFASPGAVKCAQGRKIFKRLIIADSALLRNLRRAAFAVYRLSHAQFCPFEHMPCQITSLEELSAPDVKSGGIAAGFKQKAADVPARCRTFEPVLSELCVRGA